MKDWASSERRKELQANNTNEELSSSALYSTEIKG